MWELKFLIKKKDVKNIFLCDTIQFIILQADTKTFTHMNGSCHWRTPTDCILNLHKYIHYSSCAMVKYKWIPTTYHDDGPTLKQLWLRVSFFRVRRCSAIQSTSDPCNITANMRRWPNVVLTLGQRRRRWSSVKTKLGQHWVIWLHVIRSIIIWFSVSHTYSRNLIEHTRNSEIEIKVKILRKIKLMSYRKQI